MRLPEVCGDGIVVDIGGLRVSEDAPAVLAVVYRGGQGASLDMGISESSLTVTEYTGGTPILNPVGRDTGLDTPLVIGPTRYDIPGKFTGLFIAVSGQCVGTLAVTVWAH